MMTPREFVSTTLMTHEGKLSLHKADNGNWFSRRRFKAGLPQRRFQGTLVGSMYGVTAYALAEHRGIDEVTRDMMASLKREEAIDIALTGYWRKPRLDTLEPFSPVLLAVLDMAYNAGPGDLISSNDRGNCLKKLSLCCLMGFVNNCLMISKLPLSFFSKVVPKSRKTS